MWAIHTIVLNPSEEKKREDIINNEGIMINKREFVGNAGSCPQPLRHSEKRSSAGRQPVWKIKRVGEEGRKKKEGESCF